MRVNVFLDPQEGMTWTTIATVAKAAESLGFEGLYRSDHLASTQERYERAATEAWSTLAGLAVITDRIRLGTLITPLTFREPWLLAKIVATIDEMSGGRVDVSIGTGWNTGEHYALGIPFPSMGERFSRLEEYVPVLQGLWSGEPFTFHGTYYEANNIAPRPLPSQRPRPYLIIGGHGPRRTPLLAARYANEYNIDWPSIEMCHDLYGRVRAACIEVGRDPETIVRSALLGVIVGATAAEARERRDAGLASLHVATADRDVWVAKNANAWLVGEVDEVIVRLREFAAAGVQRVMLMHAPSDDLDTLTLIGRRVIPGVADA